MTDEERCRLIAELEGLPMPPDYSGDPDYSLKAAIAFERFPDYAHDLNATMRAARRLPEGIELRASHPGRAELFDQAPPLQPYPERLGKEAFLYCDPARAAFLCLSDYLVTKKESR